MTMHVKVGGTWKEVAPGGGLSVKVSGVWKTVAEGWVKVSGAWKQFFVNAIYSVADTFEITDVFSGGASAQLNFESDGNISSNTNSFGYAVLDNWVTPTSLAPGAYTIRAHVVSGDTPTGTLDADLALTSTRTWTISVGVFETKVCVLQMTLKDGGGNTLATGQITLGAQGV
jgi:hypothetical protein